MTDRDDAIDDLLNDGIFFILCKYQEMEPLLSDTIKRNFKNFCESHDEDEMTEFMKDRIACIIYNNRHVPMRTHQVYKEMKKKESRQLAHRIAKQLDD